MASFSERYPYCAKLKLNQDSIQNPTLLKRCKKNHAVLNGLLLELYKYRKEKKLPWSTINELATIILHTPVEIKQLQQTLYKMRKHEEKLLKNKKRELDQFLKMPFMEANTEKDGTDTKEYQEQTGSKMHNLRRKLKRRDIKIEEQTKRIKLMEVDIEDQGNETKKWIKATKKITKKKVQL